MDEIFYPYISNLVARAKEKWGVRHDPVEGVSTAENPQSKKCPKCGIVFVDWSDDAIMKTECELWKKKLIGMITAV